MGSTAATLPPPSTCLMLMEGRALPELGAFWLMRPWLSLTARGDGHAVLVLPGLLADDKVRCVISLGSPFAGSPRSTNAWRAYEWASGNKVDNESVPPAVPTTSIFSRTDGICAWQACLNAEGPLIENIEIDGSHCGLGHHPAAVYAIADRLAQPEGAWQKFDRGGWRALVFPDWRRA